MIGTYEVPGIQRIGTVEDRRLVETAVPGLEGSYHQDLGAASVAVRIHGTLAGDDARDDFLTGLRGLFNAAVPVDFVADITTATEIDKVLVSDLGVVEVAGTANSFRYAIELTRHVEPPASTPDAALGFGDLGDVAAAVASEAAALVDAMQVPDLLASIPDLKDPTPPLKSTVDGVKSALGGLSDVGAKLTTLFGGA
jgi:hypothetical protein